MGLTDDAAELFRLAGVHAPGLREAVRRFAERYGDQSLARSVLHSLARRRPDPFVNQIVLEEATLMDIDLDDDPGAV